MDNYIFGTLHMHSSNFEELIILNKLFQIGLFTKVNGLFEKK